MKCNLFIIIFISFLSSLSVAQTKPGVLNGMIVVNGGDSIPYQIVITEKDGAVTGYSLTYNEPDQTKAKIKGVLDRHSHSLTFKETEILYSHGYHPGPSLCLVDASLYEQRGNNGDVLKGAISSNESDNTACGSGKIIFRNEAEIGELFSYHEKYDTVISMKKRIRDTATIKNVSEVQPPTPLVTEKITSGEEKAFEWHTDTVVIDVWDGGNVDGDRITLLYNSKEYLKGYSLIKEKKQLRIPLSGKGVDIIIIHADNEGSDPPNTASMLFTDGSTKYSVLAYNKKGDAAVIKIKRVK